MTMALHHAQYELTREQRRNCLRLCRYLLSGQLLAEFHMGMLTALGRSGPLSLAETLLEAGMDQCGSVGCALGHGPYAGVPKRRTEDWGAYSHRAFVPQEDKDGCWGSDAAWTWCFGSIWVFRDNSPQGAARRILYMLRHGVPLAPEPNPDDNDRAFYWAVYDDMTFDAVFQAELAELEAELRRPAAPKAEGAPLLPASSAV